MFSTGLYYFSDEPSARGTVHFGVAAGEISDSYNFKDDPYSDPPDPDCPYSFRILHSHKDVLNLVKHIEEETGVKFIKMHTRKHFGTEGNSSIMIQTHRDVRPNLFCTSILRCNSGTPLFSPINYFSSSHSRSMYSIMSQCEYHLLIIVFTSQDFNNNI
jgi:hypothetical protein